MSFNLYVINLHTSVLSIWISLQYSYCHMEIIIMLISRIYCKTNCITNSFEALFQTRRFIQSWIRYHYLPWDNYLFFSLQFYMFEVTYFSIGWTTTTTFWRLTLIFGLTLTYDLDLDTEEKVLPQRIHMYVKYESSISYHPSDETTMSGSPLGLTIGDTITMAETLPTCYLHLQNHHASLYYWIV